MKLNVIECNDAINFIVVKCKKYTVGFDEFNVATSLMVVN